MGRTYLIEAHGHPEGEVASRRRRVAPLPSRSVYDILPGEDQFQCTRLYSEHPARREILGPTTAILLSTKPKPREAEIFHHHLRWRQCIAVEKHKGKPEWLSLSTLVRLSI